MQEIIAIELQAGQRRIHSALVRGAFHRSAGLTPPRASIFSLAQVSTVLEFDTASVSREPDMGLVLASASTCAASCTTGAYPGLFNGILHPLWRAFIKPLEIQLIQCFTECCSKTAHYIGEPACAQSAQNAANYLFNRYNYK